MTDNRVESTQQGREKLFNLNSEDLANMLRDLAKWLGISLVLGTLSGGASAVFLISLEWATDYRVNNPSIVHALPVIGLGIGYIYHKYAGDAAKGNNLVIEEVNSNNGRIPLRMAPMVLLGTVGTHLFGGSAGREGTAIQMGASMADYVWEKIGLSKEDRKLMIMAGISGGFSSVFGTPVAGLIFGLEVQSLGRIKYDGLIPCLFTAFIGDYVTRLIGATHSHYPQVITTGIDLVSLLKFSASGIIFGLVSIAFIELIHAIRKLLWRYFPWSPVHPFIGGVVLLAMTFLVGSQDFLGLSLPLIQDSLRTSVPSNTFLIKLVFTAVTLGSGYLGGEVTPLFVIGSTCGYFLGNVLGVDPYLMASAGFVSVFAGCSNTPLACSIMAIELFGGGVASYAIPSCYLAYLASGHRGIYSTQRVEVPKNSCTEIEPDECLSDFQKRRNHG